MSGCVHTSTFMSSPQRRKSPPSDEGIAVSPNRPNKDPAEESAPEPMNRPAASDEVSLASLLGDDIAASVAPEDSVLSSDDDLITGFTINEHTVNPHFRQGVIHTIAVARELTADLVATAAKQMQTSDNRTTALVAPLGDIPGVSGAAIRPNEHTGATLAPHDIAAMGYQTVKAASVMLQLADQAAPDAYRMVIRKHKVALQYDTIMDVWRSYWALAAECNLGYDTNSADPIGAITTELKRLVRKGRKPSHSSAAKHH